MEVTDQKCPKCGCKLIHTDDNVLICGGIFCDYKQRVLEKEEKKRVERG